MNLLNFGLGIMSFPGMLIWHILQILYQKLGTISQRSFVAQFKKWNNFMKFKFKLDYVNFRRLFVFWKRIVKGIKFNFMIFWYLKGRKFMKENQINTMDIFKIKIGHRKGRIWYRKYSVISHFSIIGMLILKASNCQKNWYFS